MKFFVIGGAGYVGSHFVYEALRQGHDCVVYDSLERGHKEFVPGTVRLIVANILDEEKLTFALGEYRPDVILHYAAYALVAESVENPEMYFRNNVGGVESLLRSMKKSDTVVPLVFSSSCGVFGEPKSLPIGEDDEKNPKSPYGESKLKAEHIIEEFTRENSCSAMALRYFNACGADPSGEIGERHEPESHLIPNILESGASNRKVTIFGNDFSTRDGTCVRDYIHVSDLAESHLLAGKQMIDGKTSGFHAVHIGTGTGYSNLEVLKACSEVVGKEIMYEFGGRRAGDPAELYADNSKAKMLLHFEAKNSDLMNIVSTAWKWHQQ